MATYSKFQPLNKDFLDLTNPKAVLEMRLRHFACLSKEPFLMTIGANVFIEKIKCEGVGGKKGDFIKTG